MQNEDGKMIKVGVLAIQGAVAEHLELLNQIPDVCAQEVKYLDELNEIDITGCEIIFPCSDDQKRRVVVYPVDVLDDRRLAVQRRDGASVERPVGEEVIVDHIRLISVA